MLMGREEYFREGGNEGADAEKEKEQGLLMSGKRERILEGKEKE